MRNILTHFPWLFGAPEKPRVEVDKYGVTLTAGRRVSHFMWQEVVRIDAFKRGGAKPDDVTFAFQLKSPERVVEVSEELLDFQKLVHFLEAEWPKIPADWRMKASLPAIGESRAILYSVHT